MAATFADRYAGKAAVVTGAGSGIGQSVALRLAAEGAQVLGLDINADGLAATVERAEGNAPGGLVVRHCDVTKASECHAAIADVIERFGRLDILGNIAGIARAEHIGEVTEAAYRQMMAVNVDGYFFMAQAALPHLLHDGGVIVNVASIAGLVGQAYTVVYCMSKGAIVQLTRALAMEYMKTPLRVVAIAPGGVESGLTRGYQMPSDVDWDLVGRYVNPRGMAKPADISALFAFLASAEAKNIHGTVVSSDSGMTAG